MTSRLGVRVGALAVALTAAAAWALWRPLSFDGARASLVQDLPWFARLLERWEAILVFTFWWLLLREPRCGPGILALWGLYSVLTLSELSMGWFLGGSLALLTAGALVARPWPNRTIMARCAALAAFATGVDALAG